MSTFRDLKWSEEHDSMLNLGEKGEAKSMQFYALTTANSAYT